MQSSKEAQSQGTAARWEGTVAPAPVVQRYQPLRAVGIPSMATEQERKESRRTRALQPGAWNACTTGAFLGPGTTPASQAVRLTWDASPMH